MNREALNQLLTTIFMLLAVAAIVTFFVSSNRTLFYTLGVIAVVIRLVQYGMRLFGGGGRKRRVTKIEEELDNNIRK